MGGRGGSGEREGKGGSEGPSDQPNNNGIKGTLKALRADLLATGGRSAGVSGEGWGWGWVVLLPAGLWAAWGTILASV